MSTAAKVAREKREHPERFCPTPGCLWRVKHVRSGADTPCGKPGCRVLAAMKESSK